jgi:hypothetical protein
MTTWYDEWETIASRIGALNQVANAFVASVQFHHKGDYHGVADTMVIPSLQAVHGDLKAFAQRHFGALPPGVDERLRQLMEVGFQFYMSPQGLTGTVALAASLAMIRTEIDPLMRNNDLQRVHIAERAFLHLQRLIVADVDFRSKWQAAFAAGEVACEKLGGAHLLHHGIYAIKSNAAGERTDLVLGDRLAITPKLRRSSDAMALTEWKIVRNRAYLGAVVDDARGQALRYAEGSLAGFEISSVRFLVTVSDDVLAERDDELVDNVTYRHVNIAVDPSTPSRS